MSGGVPWSLAVALSIAALSTAALSCSLMRASWVVQEEQGFAELGLWWTCLNTTHVQLNPGIFQRFTTECPSYYGDEMFSIFDWVVPGWLMAVQILMVSGVALHLVGWLAALILTDNHNDGGCCCVMSEAGVRWLHYSTALCFLGAGVLHAIAVLMFLLLSNHDFWLVHYESMSLDNFGDGFFLALGGTLAEILAAIFFSVAPPWQRTVTFSQQRY